MKSLYIVIIGCGRLGSILANRLSFMGNSVVIIDKNASAFEALNQDFSGFRLEGDAAQIRVLEEAKMSDADWIIAATHDDNVNLMVTQVAREIFSVPHVLARIFDPNREQVYTRLGIDTFCPTSVAAQLFIRAVTDTQNGTGGDAA